MRVVPQDVGSFGEGDILKVLTVNLHDLKGDRLKNEKHSAQKLPGAQGTPSFVRETPFKITHHLERRLVRHAFSATFRGQESASRELVYFTKAVSPKLPKKRELFQALSRRPRQHQE